MSDFLWWPSGPSAADVARLLRRNSFVPTYDEVYVPGPGKRLGYVLWGAPENGRDAARSGWTVSSQRNFQTYLSESRLVVQDAVTWQTSTRVEITYRTPRLGHYRRTR